MTASEINRGSLGAELKSEEENRHALDSWRARIVDHLNAIGIVTGFEFVILGFIFNSDSKLISQEKIVAIAIIIIIFLQLWLWLLVYKSNRLGSYYAYMALFHPDRMDYWSGKSDKESKSNNVKERLLECCLVLSTAILALLVVMQLWRN